MKAEIIITTSIALMVHICSTIWWASKIDAKVKMNEHDVLRIIYRMDRMEQEFGEWQLKK